MNRSIIPKRRCIVKPSRALLPALDGGLMDARLHMPDPPATQAIRNFEKDAMQSYLVTSTSSISKYSRSQP